MKIVIDTNIILSALFSNKGASNKLLVWLFENKKRCLEKRALRGSREHALYILSNAPSVEPKEKDRL